ncbi:DNA photolyase, putative [Eimeria praecox]|uniref:DNA photolyase, putative n=1 Tax=Eimeria praecox TaxID=51316 RepID=U6H6A1_9EIME|nr:DNA photolyase, putative [Eimeria praecox]
MPSGDPKEKQETSRSKRRKPHPKSPSKESLPESPSRPRKKAPLEASTAPTNSPGGLIASAKAKGKWLQGTVDSRRVRCLTPTVTVPNPSGECVVCFLQRDLRLQDNWALLFAQDAALSLKTPLHVLHLVAPGYCFQRTSRHLQFHLQGVKELAAGLAAHDISFHCFPVVAADAAAAEAEAKGRMQTALQELSPKVVVCDLMPLRCASV